MNVSGRWRCELTEFNGEADHVHLLVTGHPTVALSRLVGNLKTVSARYMRAAHAQHLKKFFWKKIFWSGAYAAFNVGAADLATIIRYIQEQESPALPATGK
ncbi:MAG: IS200/IS605 family transposase [Agitococcus sp.]|nr:IS200/IS605 family transposase [Agitococcus sp.]